MVTVPEVHTLYLPIIYAGPYPALKGVSHHPAMYSDLIPLNVEWYYDWRFRPPVDHQGSGYVPMIWGRGTMRFLDEAIENARPSGWLMGFNEPDLESQANISPREAAELWRQIEARADDIKLLSPAPSHEHPEWLWEMVTEYEKKYGRNPRFDAIAAHLYSPDPEWAKSYLIHVRQDALAHGYDVPIWLTEFGGICTIPPPGNGNERLMRELVPWMQEQSWMDRYAWYKAMMSPNIAGWEWRYCSLLDYKTGQPTELGELYKEY